MNSSRLTAIGFLLCLGTTWAHAGPDPAAPAVPAPLPAALQEAGDEADALALIDAAREERRAAYEAMEALILELRDDYDALVSGPDAATNKHALVLSITDSLPQARTRLAAERAQGRPVQRGNRRRILLEAIEEPITAASPVDERLGVWVGRRVADELSRNNSFDDVTADDVLRIVDGLFDAEANWWIFWNDEFHHGLPEVERYQAADEALLAAGLALNRVKFPERYTSRGEEAPPGMVVVPGGNYDLGPNVGWERPGRRVNLRSFAIDRTEVTARAYALFLESLPRSQARRMLPRSWDLDDDGKPLFDTSRRDHPVLYVNYDQAAAYAEWAGKRLPTENEWEAAAAGFEGFVYPWGNNYEPGRAQADEGFTAPIAVGSFPDARSPVGCYDMAGNVWEWTATTGDDNKDFDELPKGLVNVIIRGGGFDSPWDKLTTRYRRAAPGHDAFGSPRYVVPIGFRCVKDLR